MNNLSLVRTDHVQRYHLFVDTEAARFDAFLVELCPIPAVLVAGTGKSTDELWRDALATVAWLRTQPSALPYPSSVFVPFARIVAVDAQRESAKASLQMSMLVGRCSPDQTWPPPVDDPSSHEDRVQSLCRALDLIDVLSTKPQAQRVN